LKDERPDLRVVGVDLSAAALEVARANATRLGLDVEFVQADLLRGIPGRFDALMANLPYVASGAELPPEITRYEPVEALFAGEDGLEAITRLVEEASGVPLVAREVGFEQGAAGRALLGRAGFSSIEVLRDLAGHERVIVGRGP